VEYQQPIYSGPARGAKIAAIVVLALFTIRLMVVWATGGGDDGEPGNETPVVPLEEGTLPPIVGDTSSAGDTASADDTSTGGVLPATP
jgi:hypothetical protein